MALWTPSNDTSGALFGWWDLNDSSTLTVATTVSQIRDKSGNSRHWSQATSGKQGTLTATNSNLNNLQTITVPTSGGYTPTSAFSLPDGVGVEINTIDFTAGVDFQIGAMSGDSVNYNISPKTYPTSGIFGFHWKTGLTYGFNQTTNNGKVAFLNGTQVSTFVNSVSATQTAATGGLVIAAARPGPSGGGGYGRFFDVTGSFLNRSSDWARTFDGALGEMIVLSGNISDATRQLYEGYLAWKWGQQASLPGGHPYASAAPTYSTLTPTKSYLRSNQDMYPMNNTRSLTVTYPSTDTIPFFYSNTKYTIAEVRSVLRAAPGSSVTFSLYSGSDRTGASNTLIGTYTCNSTSYGNTANSFVTYTSPILDSSQKTTDMVLSNNNLTVTKTGTAVFDDKAITSTSFANTANIYFEALITNFTNAASNTGFGIADSTVLASNNTGGNWLGGDTHAATYWNAGQIYINNAALTTLAGWRANSELIRCCFNAPAKRLWVMPTLGTSLWNNSATADPSANIGGIDVSTGLTTAGPYRIGFNFEENGAQGTLLLTPNLWNYPAPSGFSAFVANTNTSAGVIAANSYVWCTITNVTGNVSEFHVSTRF